MCATISIVQIESGNNALRRGPPVWWGINLTAQHVRTYHVGFFIVSAGQGLAEYIFY